MPASLYFHVFPTVQPLTFRYCHQTLEKIASLKPMHISHAPRVFDFLLHLFGDTFRYSHMASREIHSEASSFLESHPTLGEFFYLAPGENGGAGCFCGFGTTLSNSPRRPSQRCWVWNVWHSMAAPTSRCHTGSCWIHRTPL